MKHEGRFRRHSADMATHPTFLRSLAVRLGLAALAVILIEVVFPAAIAAQNGL